LHLPNPATHQSTVLVQLPAKKDSQKQSVAGEDQFSAGMVVVVTAAGSATAYQKTQKKKLLHYFIIFIIIYF
jgi:hypothetical protein